MSEWCKNRFEITGKSICIDLLQQWITGQDVPHYRHAIQQSIQLFLAGCGGLLKPVRTTTYPPFPELVKHGLGAPTPANQAFEQWLGLLLRDKPLNAETIKTIDRLYHQSGLGAVEWENIPEPARGSIADLLIRQHADWFSMVSITGKVDPADSWKSLRIYHERAQPCDMILVIPTRLSAELNGNSSLLIGKSTTSSLYSRLYGIEWPAGHSVNWQRQALNSLTLNFDSPWYPPSGELIGEISALFECEIRHTYSEPVNGIYGYDCYDSGEHVDGHKGLPPVREEEEQSVREAQSSAGQVFYLVNPDIHSYQEVRG
ncbi:TPA: DUF1281 domain-containing protein [Salmonella enterica]|uniref:DUF1281 domain-containing protein n=1 Tax=Salmonella enterica TaxID=28901 RepID=UPI0009B0F02D|nr:DUF1281 domain-containing protein [Salmonella enterica]HBD1844087.1 DUF1281 domain-containing protein [Salmonella enterica]